MSLRKLVLIGGALLALALILFVASCGERATLLVSAGMGPAPTLPRPAKTLLPTVKVAEAIGWKRRALPSAALAVG